MHPVLSNRVVLMAAILAGGLSLAFTLAARSTLVPHVGPAAVEPSTLGGGSAAADVPGVPYLEGGYELAAFSGAIPRDISTVRAVVP